MDQTNKEEASGLLVPLVRVETLSEAEVITSMLRAYGIHAHRGSKARYEPYEISVINIDLDPARGLLSPDPAGL
jgi:hypothetical protein